MGSVRRWVLVAVVLVLVGSVTVWFLVRGHNAEPGCTITGPSSGSGGSSSGSSHYTLSPEQADNAATIAGVARKLGMPDHAVTIALATAMQESKLTNLSGGDRDSAGLFQQRPSQGWGSYAQITDPVYASTAFYQHLAKVAGWTQLSVTEAAQAVQHSAAPDGYAPWEAEATAAAIVFTGESAAALTCHDVTVGTPKADLATIASDELGTTAVSGRHDSASGWAVAAWLVAHCIRLGIDKVTFDGQTWTASSGAWSRTGVADGMLSLHQMPNSSGSS